eukprot:491799-Alexandrium_andersonii.AAC.1
MAVRDTSAGEVGAGGAESSLQRSDPAGSRQHPCREGWQKSPTSCRSLDLEARERTAQRRSTTANAAMCARDDAK